MSEDKQYRTKWLNPPPRPKEVTEPLPPYDPTALSFAEMRKQLDPNNAIQSRKLVFRTNSNAELDD